MVKYPNNKQTMFFQKALIMVLSLCLILPLLAGCSGSSDTKYENIRISNNCPCIHYISWSVPYEFFDHYILTCPNTYEDPQFAPIEAKTYTYKGVEYTLTRPIGQTLDDICQERLYSLRGVNENGDNIFILFTEEDKAPVKYRCDSAIYGDEREYYDTNDMIEVSADFIDYFINECSTDSVDLSNYKELGIIDNKICFTRYFRGIPIHTIEVMLNDKCQVMSISMSTPILDESIYNKIPNISDDEYREMAEWIVNYAYSRENDSPTISNFEIDAKLYDHGYEFKYSHGEQSYVITYEPSFTVSLPDGTSEDMPTPSTLVSYVLDSQTKNQD